MKLGVTLDILNQKDTPAFYADTLANRPAAGFTGRVFISTDTLDLYRDTGTTWVLLSPSSTGTITGSGAAGQVTYFSAASSITGNNNLFWDSANNHLGIQTATPDCALDVNHNGTFVAKFNNTTSANTLIGIFNLDNPQWLIGSNSVANDLTFYDATNFPTLVATTTMKTDGTTFIGGQTTGSGRLNVYSATGDNGIQISGANAPSLRIDNAPTGATKRIGLGISTATNNFIQGSADRDMCIFNGSTTASPMLFGIYDTTNVQEAARISAARNFLIGTTTDAGQKLYVNGTALINNILTVNNNIITSGQLSFTASTSQTAGSIARNAFYGLTLFGIAGTNSDFGLVNSLGNEVYKVPTGTINSVFSGNIGIGTTPNAWISGWKAIDLGIYTSLASGFGNTRLYSNAYNGSTGDIYVSNGAASVYTQTGGEHLFYNATSGIAGNNVTFNASLVIKNNGNTLIGTTTDAGYSLQVNGTCLTNQYRISASGSNARYNIVDANDTYTGSYNIQAGAGSSGFGGSLVLFGHSNATKPGWVEVGISALSGGKFNVSSVANNGGGTALFQVLQNGQINIPITQTYASNALALAGGLVVGDVYKTATGQLQIVY